MILLVYTLEVHEVFWKYQGDLESRLNGFIYLLTYLPVVPSSCTSRTAPCPPWTLSIASGSLCASSATCHSSPGPQLTTGSGFGDPRIVWSRGEGDIQIFVLRTRSISVRVHQQHATPWRIPPFIVQHDRQDGEAVATRDPLDLAWHREQVGPIPDDLHDKFAFSRATVLDIGGQLDPQGSTTGPSHPPSTTVNPGIW